MLMTYIFDLDRSVIDSDHRYRTKENGDIDLQYWLDHCYDPVKVARDTLLPLAHKWRQIQMMAHTVIVACTSRSACQNHLTEAFLQRHGLHYDEMLCRGPNTPEGGDQRGDATLKVDLLSEFFRENDPDLSPHRAVMFDDHGGVRQAVQSALGIVCLNPAPHTWLPA